MEETTDSGAAADREAFVVGSASSARRTCPARHATQLLRALLVLTNAEVTR